MVVTITSSRILPCRTYKTPTYWFFYQYFSYPQHRRMQPAIMSLISSPLPAPTLCNVLLWSPTYSREYASACHSTYASPHLYSRSRLHRRRTYRRVTRATHAIRPLSEFDVRRNVKDYWHGASIASCQWYSLCPRRDPCDDDGGDGGGLFSASNSHPYSVFWFFLYMSPFF